ncbi:MAG: M28 family peptidase [Bacteroidetes bacterium]|nr:M28 family peptidase [Bacteroidota bacterium]
MKLLRPNYVPLGILLLICVLAGCESDTPQGQAVELKGPELGTPAIALKTQFDAEQAYQYVARQVQFGPRVPGTAAHRQCGDWLVQELKALGAEVHEQKTELRNHLGQLIPIRNIIASYQPDAKSRIMLSAHWDTRPLADEDPSNPAGSLDGANDGASGVGVLLALARALKEQQPGMGVDIFLWDAEDGGVSGNDNSWCLGSRYWAQHPHRANYTAQFGINLDMVGAAQATFPQEGWGAQTAGAIQDRLWQQAHSLGYGQYFPFAELGSILDDHSVVGQLTGIPYLDIIHLRLDAREGSFFEHWHTQGDRLEVIDKKTLEAVGTTLLHFIFSLPA